MPFAQWLQSKIDLHGFTNYRIAKMAGVHQSTVAHWLMGAKPQAEKENLIRQAISEYEKSLSDNSDGGIKKDTTVTGDVSELSDLQREAWNMLRNMDDDALRAFITLARAKIKE